VRFLDLELVVFGQLPDSKHIIFFINFTKRRSAPRPACHGGKFFNPKICS